MTSTLYVVGAPEPSRATRIDALTVDRSKYLGFTVDGIKYINADKPVHFKRVA